MNTFHKARLVRISTLQETKDLEESVALPPHLFESISLRMIAGLHFGSVLNCFKRVNLQDGKKFIVEDLDAHKVSLYIDSDGILTAFSVVKDSESEVKLDLLNTVSKVIDEIDDNPVLGAELRLKVINKDLQTKSFRKNNSTRLRYKKMSTNFCDAMLTGLPMRYVVVTNGYSHEIARKVRLANKVAAGNCQFQAISASFFEFADEFLVCNQTYANEEAVCSRFRECDRSLRKFVEGVKNVGAQNILLSTLRSHVGKVVMDIKRSDRGEAVLCLGNMEKYPESVVGVDQNGVVHNYIYSRHHHLECPECRFIMDIISRALDTKFEEIGPENENFNAENILSTIFSLVDALNYL
ncbi:hypothetical protein [Fundidesulfovibrio soli]|uniref:hypothetical protein n=1 Tax=Fundidesulfovibrio soli TaxID=2922716 RepID=UPI001FAFB1AB|nr:hypothetical protein [Fundidesulfovibrio soli]